MADWCLVASWTQHKFLKVRKPVITEQFRHKNSIFQETKSLEKKYEGVHSLVAVNYSAHDKMKHVCESDEHNAPCRKMLRAKNVQPKDGNKIRKVFFF